MRTPHTAGTEPANSQKPVLQRLEECETALMTQAGTPTQRARLVPRMQRFVGRYPDSVVRVSMKGGLLKLSVKAPQCSLPLLHVPEIDTVLSLLHVDGPLQDRAVALVDSLQAIVEDIMFKITSRNVVPLKSRLFIYNGQVVIIDAEDIAGPHGARSQTERMLESGTHLRRIALNKLHAVLGSTRAMWDFLCRIGYATLPPPQLEGLHQACALEDSLVTPVGA
jgi:hypothetical protein